MTDIHLERAHLVEANRHIATGKRLIARIEALINEIRSTGAQTAESGVLALSHLNRASAFAMHTNLITPMAAFERFVMFDE